MIFVAIDQTNKHKAKIYGQCTYTQIIIKKSSNFFFTDYKNEWKEHKILNIDDFDINKILFSKTESYDKKKKKKKKNAFEYFIGYHDNDVMDHYIYGI